MKITNLDEAMAAVEQNGYALQEVPDELKTKELCLAAVEEYGLALEYVPEELKTKEICLAAVEQFGYALRDVPLKFKSAEVCLEAVNSNGLALEFVPTIHKTRKLCALAFEKTTEAHQFIPKRFQRQDTLISPFRHQGGKYVGTTAVLVFASEGGVVDFNSPALSLSPGGGAHLFKPLIDVAKRFEYFSEKDPESARDNVAKLAKEWLKGEVSVEVDLHYRLNARHAALDEQPAVVDVVDLNGDVFHRILFQAEENSAYSFDEMVSQVEKAHIRNSMSLEEILELAEDAAAEASVSEAQTTIDVVFECVDYWNRPIFKSVSTDDRFGSTDNLVRDVEEAKERVTERDLSYFGSHFDCEPMGTTPSGPLRIVGFGDTLSVRSIETGKSVCEKSLTRDELQYISDEEVSQLDRISRLEYLAVDLAERSGITANYDGLYLCISNFDGVAIKKAGFDDPEHHAMMVHRQRVLDEVKALGATAGQRGVDDISDCRFTQAILQSDTDWWPNQSSSSAKEKVTNVWWAARNAAAESENLARNKGLDPEPVQPNPDISNQTKIHSPGPR
jgi:hypothetical protein